MSFEIALTNQQTTHAVDEARLVEAARAVLSDSTFTSAEISIAVVNDPTIHELNVQFLQHDYPTDVLSFSLHDDGDRLEGEVIVSADTAATLASELGCSAAAEQMLYVVHGLLHLVGYRDKTLADAEEMQAAEAKYLRQFGYEPVARGEHGSQTGADKELPNGATIQ